jgi:hypothetical protein
MIHGCSWSGAILVALLSASLQAAEMPDIKVGLWSVESSEATSGEPKSTLVCMNTAVLQELMKSAAKVVPADKCQTAIDKKDSSYIETTDCKVRRGALHVQSVATFTGKEKFHIEFEDTSFPTRPIDGKYVSACPAAMQVGDAVGPNGAKATVVSNPSGPPSAGAQQADPASRNSASSNR